MDRFDEYFDEYWNYYSLTHYDVENRTAEHFITSIVPFDGGKLFLTRTATQVYGGVSLALTGVVLTLRLFIFPHLLFESLRIFCFTSLSLLVISITQIVQNACQLYHGYLIMHAYLYLPLITTYSVPVYCSAWLLQSLLYLTLVPATVVQSIIPKKAYLVLCVVLSLAFFGLNYPPFQMSTLFFDFPLWSIAGYTPLPYTNFSLAANQCLDLGVAAVMLVFLVLLAAACPFAGARTPKLKQLRQEVFWTSVYYCVTMGISLAKTLIVHSTALGESKHVAAVCYLGNVLWGLGKPLIYMAVHRKSLCFRKIMP